MNRALAATHESSRPATTNTVVAPVVEFLSRHAPFDQMSPAHVEFLAKRLNLGFYARGERITEPEQGPAGVFYIIKQGRVRGETEDERGPSEEGAWELVAGECFPIGALLGRRPVRTVHRAVEDSFCFELHREDFEKLLSLSPVFHDFCSRRLANLLDQALRAAQATHATEVSGDASLSAPLANLVRRDPVSCVAATPIRTALERMQTERVGSMIVTDEERRPIGVFTLHDLLPRVVGTGVGLDTPMSEVMTPQVHTLPPQATAHEAAVLMADRGIGHVCLVEDGKLAGVVSERDLFSLQRIGLVNLSRSITGAPDLQALARHGRDIRRLIDQMLVQGASVAQLLQIITLLNDHVARRAIGLTLAETGMPGVAFSWISFGSEGRQEQTLKTDQDNGIVFEPARGRSTEAVRAELLPLARRINEALAACGYPLCPGNIMASNPQCCLTLDEWQDRFDNWIDRGEPEHLLAASIFFDLRTLWGDDAPVAELRRWLAERVPGNQRFLRQMAENALRNQPPLGLVRDFQLESGGEHAHMLDLKLRGATPFVDGARLLALAHGINESNTLARLRASTRAGVIKESEAAAWCDAYAFIQLLRMRTHQARAREDKPLDNHVDPDSLNDLDRRILKESFRQARKLQTRLRLDYQL